MFEEVLIPQEVREAAARANVANDARQIRDGKADPALAGRFWPLAAKLYPGYEDVKEPEVQIPLLYQRLPVGCNVACTGCYTSADTWRAKETHLNYPETVDVVRQAADLGCRVVKLIGDGELGLVRKLPDFVHEAKKFGVDTIICTNALRDAPPMRGALDAGARLYIKHWAESAELMDSMTKPRGKGYEFETGKLGPAPRLLYEYFERAPDRVGVQVAFDDRNMRDAMNIIARLRNTLPVYAEPFIETQTDPAIRVVSTKSCVHEPPYTAWATTVGSSGELCPGSFVDNNAFSIRESGLLEGLNTAFTQRADFFNARYVRSKEGCYCATHESNGTQELLPGTQLVTLGVNEVRQQ